MIHDPWPEIRVAVLACSSCGEEPVHCPKHFTLQSAYPFRRPQWKQRISGAKLTRLQTLAAAKSEVSEHSFHAHGLVTYVTQFFFSKLGMLRTARNRALV